MSSFDYVVVGGGSAGCVVAARLSEDPGVSVLLLEAGGDERRPDVETPDAWSTLLGTDADWAYETVHQPATGRVHAAPRGRVLGGSGSINCMAHLRGHRLDFDEWAGLGAKGWAYDDVLPYFKRSEDVPDGDPVHRGQGGPLHPRTDRAPGAMGKAYLEGAVRLGHAVVDDLNAGEMLGVGHADALVHNGRRESTASAYLRPVMDRPNLTVLTHTVVRRLTVEAGRCTGVEYLCQGEPGRAFADAEVVLCGGAVASPHLLMLSGIGPAEELAGLGIAPVVDLPHVGRNLQDHILLAGIRYRATRRVQAPDAGGGPTLFVRTDPGEHGPDLQLSVMAGDYRMPWQQPMDNAFTFLIGHMRPRSRGTIRLVSADPDVAPLIDPAYLHDTYDLDQLILGVEHIDRLVRTSVFDEWGGVSETSLMLRNDRAGLERAVRTTVSSYFHLSGTCRMGSDADAVVDPQLRVNGVPGLRVADASVMPTVVSCNTNAATVMIGEKAADLLRGRDA
ncbi:GMC family oxidoreductase [Streptomyces sp. NPDC048425]|uniref:GMC family oxidoreductase n=1 Tax=Streptomyces sp. NPDC048425 TaxID=3365548 RepID=UPI00371B58A8